VWTASLLVPLVAAVVSVFLGQHDVINVTIGHVQGHLHPVSALILYVITGLFVQRIVSNSSNRRRDAFQRSLIVAECNHHIRNALQSITSTAFLNGYKENDAAVTRIERTLTDILPRLQVSGDAHLLDDETSSCGKAISTAAVLSAFARLGTKDKNVVSLDSPVPGFVHKTLSNGLTVATCQGCMKSIGSPMPNSLRMSEENHLCSRTRKAR
jgi:hypothetical protein